MKFREFLNEAKNAKDIVLGIYEDRKYNWLRDSIESICQKINPKADGFDELEDKDFEKVKKELEKKILNDLKVIIYNWIEGGEIPNTLDISLTKKEFQNSLKTVSGKKIPVDRDGMPYDDVKDYDLIMDFYKKYVK